MKLLLVSISLEKATMSFPLGLSILKTVLDSTPSLPGGFETEVLPTYLSDYTDSGSAPEPGAAVPGAVEKILEKILAADPDIIGFSVYIWNRKISADISQSLKALRPEIFQLAGGAEATANPESLMEDSEIDILLRGDGEMVLPKLIATLATGNQPAIGEGIFTGNGTVPPPVYNPSPGDVPSTFLEETISTDGYPGILWETARGCPYGCSFCYESRGRRKIAVYPYDRLAEELKLFSRRGICRIFVLDPSFNANKIHALKILSLIKEYAREIHFTFEIKGEEMDEELADAFGEINCYLQLGLQSTNPKALRIVNRIFDRKRFTEACRLLNSRDVPFGVDLIYGLPADDYNEFLESLDYALELQPENLDIFPLAVLPGTRLGDEAESLGLKYAKKAPYLIESAPDFPPEDLRKADNLTKAADSFLSGSAVRYWLKPLLRAAEITPSRLLILYSEASDNNEFDGKSIEKFITKILIDREKENALSAILSLIRLYDGIENASASGLAQEKILFFSPDDLENTDSVDLADFPIFFEEKKQSWLIWIEEGELLFEPLLGEDSF